MKYKQEEQKLAVKKILMVVVAVMIAIGEQNYLKE